MSATAQRRPGPGPAGWLRASHRAQLRSTPLCCRLRATQSPLSSSTWSHLFSRPFVHRQVREFSVCVRQRTRCQGEKAAGWGWAQIPALLVAPQWEHVALPPRASVFWPVKWGRWHLLHRVMRLRWEEVFETLSQSIVSAQQMMDVIKRA